MRPELTFKAVKKLLSWPKLGNLNIVIDGLRNSAGNQERDWRLETISVVSNLSNDPRIGLDIYDANIGLTNHIIRVQKKYLTINPETIWLEEDFSVDLDSFINFSKNVPRPVGPYLIAGNSQNNHRSSSSSFRKSLFPPYWSQILNLELVEEIEKLKQDKNIDPYVSRELFSSIFSKGTLRDRLMINKNVEFWNQYFHWGCTSPSRWDSLATYVLWKHHESVVVPNRNLVDDLSGEDSRGMNVRHTKWQPRLHELQTITTPMGEICFECDMKKNRVAKSLGGIAYEAVRYRVLRLHERRRFHWFSSQPESI
jgi:hypothetical protein